MERRRCMDRWRQIRIDDLDFQKNEKRGKVVGTVEETGLRGTVAGSVDEEKVGVGI